jgi:glutathionylspermidine synthase
MVLANLFVLMEDNRFREIKNLKKKEVPHILHWFINEDSFSEELFGFYSAEIRTYSSIAFEAFKLFEQATDKVIREKKLGDFNIPSYFHKTLEESWQNKNEHPFLLGRFDINGGLDNHEAKVIEFNADTCSTIPETIFWQSEQLKQLSGKTQWNDLKRDLGETFRLIKSKINADDPFFLASSFGYKEDVLNCNALLDIANEVGYKCAYDDLERVVFADEEGIFFRIGEEYQPVDVWFKLIPWDWIINEEQELARSLIKTLEHKKCIILNPPYTALWQNKKFLAYITAHFPNNFIAETYLSSNNLSQFVEKPILGRLGENISINANITQKSKGDYDKQEKVFQKYYPLNKDLENYYYQIGVFYTYHPSALNMRAEAKPIITDDCEFMSHYII